MHGIGGELAAVRVLSAGIGALRSIFDSASSLRHDLHRVPAFAMSERLMSGRLGNELDAVGASWRARVTPRADAGVTGAAEKDAHEVSDT
ncbi:hypothetical protein [Microbacterium sp. G2-8]|uniref:hypothetical protein n=1 Tax=Microbacterium sp. G2-8 TaxID=2842454 RepID=UPI001C891A97|nr:hypothetical protein [Microbacterium sp. G2-8]